ncbi:MAG: VOC family protein [Streptosporangiaceae bacterium]
MLPHLTSNIKHRVTQSATSGAVIAEEPADQFYGDRTYRAFDPEGHCWTFSMHVRDVTKAEAEAAIGQPIMAADWR